ncbi:MAG: N-acetyl sugar amidotransferase [Chitinophagaceae bacterium]|nr:MAG: N-acetyl sugar amidotransferase [Chitinophagaceae bacterium]
MFSWKYDEEALKRDPVANNGRAYQQCTRTVMDTIADPLVQFDENGISHYYHQYYEVAKSQLFLGEAGRQKTEAMIAELKANRKGKYDCIIGLSGGVDSTYLVYKAKEWGLNPLIVHFDYGWNLELAVQNIEQTLRYTGFELYTYVMNWEDFKALQRAYIKAGVLDLDVPADHLIFAALSRVARKFGIRYQINGFNMQSEQLLPLAWNYNFKFDLKNMEDIYRKHGDGRKIRNLPKLGIWQRIYYDYIFKLKRFTPLNYFDYNKEHAKKELIEKMGWIDYGGKHFENVFTRFYQGYILPSRFQIDKRKAHLSSLICSGQVTRAEALAEIARPPYDLKIMEDDYNYVSKKLGFTPDEFDHYLSQPIRLHSDFREEAHIHGILSKFKKLLIKK